MHLPREASKHDSKVASPRVVFKQVEECEYSSESACKDPQVCVPVCWAPLRLQPEDRDFEHKLCTGPPTFWLHKSCTRPCKEKSQDVNTVNNHLPFAASAVPCAEGSCDAPDEPAFIDACNC